MPSIDTTCNFMITYDDVMKLVMVMKVLMMMTIMLMMN